MKNSKTKLSVKITLGIGVLLALLGGILGLVYVMTGDIVEVYGEKYFMGHILNADGTVNTSEAREILAIITFIVTMLSVIISAISLIIHTKGWSKVEKKVLSKKFIITQIGFLLLVIGAVALIFIMPKETDTKAKSPIWYYISACVILVGAISITAGIFDGNKKLKIDSLEPMIKNN